MKKKKKCGYCNKLKEERDFTRRDSETGLMESDFEYCNKCVNWRGIVEKKYVSV